MFGLMEKELDMTTVTSRKFRSTPYRDAIHTWAAIVDLLTRSNQSNSKRELEAVAGIAASCIADQALKDAPIIISCDGPRTRIYCLYDEEAIEGSDAKEEALGFDPLKGDWRLSLPCDKDDLSWVQSALKKHSSRISARDLAVGIADQAENSTSAKELTINIKGFIG